MALALRPENACCSKGCRPCAPVAGSGTTAITDAWQKAVATLKKSVPSKQLDRIQSTTKPADIVAQVKQWEQDHSKTGRATIAKALETCINRMERFSTAIDQLAQGSPQPACLLWGSIKFVLLVSGISHSSFCVIDFSCPANSPFP